jgi:hypothetical protein
MFEKNNRASKNFINSNNKNKINMDNQIIIELGHYQEKSTIGSDKVNIIKIIGPVPNKDGYWLTLDNQKIPEYILIENFVRLDIAPTQKGNKKPNKKLFMGFEPVKEQNQNINTQNVQDNSQIIVQSPSSRENQEKIITSVPDGPTFKQEEIIKEHEYKNILDKLNYTHINKQHIDKFGIPKTKDNEKISITLDINFPFDLEKVKQTSKLLELDFKKVSEYLLSTITINNINKLIEEKLINLLETTEPTEVIKQPIEPKIEINSEISTVPIIKTEIEPEIETKTEVNIILEEKISEIDKFLSNFINK